MKLNPIALLPALLAASCGGHDSTVIPESLAIGQHITFNVTGLSDSTRLVVRDQSTWDAVWNRLQGTATPERAAPIVDFKAAMVVVAAQGMRPTSGYTIRVDKVDADGNGAVATVVETSPSGAPCGQTSGLTTPADLVAVAQTNGPVRFLERAETSSCAP